MSQEGPPRGCPPPPRPPPNTEPPHTRAEGSLSRSFPETENLFAEQILHPKVFTLSFWGPFDFWVLSSLCPHNPG